MEVEQRACDDEIGNGRQVNDVQKWKKVATKWKDESKLVWQIAGPAILTAVSQFSFGFITAAFVGQVGHVELAAVSEVQNVVEGFVYGIMLGMGSALETLCGQAVGASEFNMLGIYLQRSWIITGVTALLLTPAYVFTSPILKLLRQDKHISHVAGKYAIWVIPQLFAYALNFPIQKFLQAQAKVWVMAIISVAALAVHGLLSWVLVMRLDRGLLGAAIAGNVSWWILIIAQIVYIVSGSFPDSWTGFSWLAFKSLFNFVKLSLASAAMLCLELWYFTAVILMVGGLNNAAVAVDSVSICVNLQLWALMVALGFNASVSVRVSNELGGGNPEAAKFSVKVNVITSAILGTIFTAIVASTVNQFPRMFTKNEEVMKETSKLGYLLAATIFLNSVQPVFHGVAVGAGWQFLVALVNLVSYYVVGLPFGALLGFKFDLGVKGIWSAMLGGSVLQTLILYLIIARTNWHKEALQAEERVRYWGGPVENQECLEQSEAQRNGNETR
ncbi:PREDICTED: protein DETOXIFICATION 33-like [Ipomoea nil]|uniref:protein DETOXIFICATION 33-like n=1 Tax=Ipomoea nil TaxID=35883 RepID=UPI000901E084|nr:PREDICTED: protein DETOXIFICATION 33-like [Ipomoea nil]